MSDETVDDGRIARIMLNRPEARNAQNCGMVVGLDEAFLRAEAHRLGMVSKVFPAGPARGQGQTLRRGRRRALSPTPAVAWPT